MPLEHKQLQLLLFQLPQVPHQLRLQQPTLMTFLGQHHLTVALQLQDTLGSVTMVKLEQQQAHLLQLLRKVQVALQMHIR